MNHTILNGDVLECLRSLPDCSVQCVVTSPPYWGLRDYGVEGQIGLEPTPEEHVERMVEVFREVRRVLRDDGTLWLNYGDCYYTGGRGSPDADANRIKDPNSMQASHSANAIGCAANRRDIKGMKPKDLVGMPWRVAFALQAGGWYLRSDIIWSKPNPMPESVTDRPTKSHEYVFLLTKRPRYFYDADAIREAQNWVGGAGNRNYRAWSENGREAEGQSNRPNPAGRNRRTVWEIPTQPTPEAHFATFPEALVEPCIKAGTSARGACPECGAPWRRVTERGENTGKNGRYDASETTLRNDAAKHSGRIGETPVHMVGWQPSCTCGREETVPCVVLDPFGGSGTVAKVARDLGRSSILIEINPEYVQIAKKRLRIGEQLDSGVCEYFVRKLPLAGR